jgi:hypothetical protein
MKKQNTIFLVGLSTVLAVGTILFITDLTRKRRIEYERREIADEGYETAQDILFPLKSQLRRSKRRLA